jgi:YD repeat-containing protein
LVQGNRSYSYTSHQRLATASDAGVEVTSFAYNELGQRQAKDRPDGTGRRFLYRPDGELLVETGCNGNLLREYLCLNGSGALDTRDLVILSRMILNLVWKGLLDSDAGEVLLPGYSWWCSGLACCRSESGR